MEKNKIKLKKTLLAPALMVCLVIVYLCTMVGAADVSLADANRIILYKILHQGDISDLSQGAVAIIWNIRLPRVLLGFIAGSALAVCGAAYQGIFKNPMADPFILGVSSGAALGASIGIILNLNAVLWGFSFITLLSLAGSFAAIALVYGISRVGGKVPVSSLLLSGVAVNATLSSIMSLIMMLNHDSMDKIIFWTMGSLNGKGWEQIITVLPWVLIGMIVLFTASSDLDIMLTGEDTAATLGVSVERTKTKVLIASSVITAAVISVTGIIGFVGLVIPHVVRIITGPKHKILMPVCLITGGAFLVICDSFARSLITSEIPVGAITAAFGGPFFLFLLHRARKGGSE